MDLLERARALATCPLFEGLAPAVLIRLAERASVHELGTGERRTTDETVWVVAKGTFDVSGVAAKPGSVAGMIRAVSEGTAIVELVAAEPGTLVSLAVDDVRDVLEEDAAALAALADHLASQLAEVL